MAILETLQSHQDLKALNEKQRKILCREIRDFLVSSVAQTGGHLASNLGVVELTVALETVYDTQKDRLVFDVGHQAYVHKLLTGRQADFSALRQYGGLAGFPKPSESQTDAFVAGHASSSVSIALGMARARTAQKQDYQVVALIGDGAATGGMAYEGLNDAAVSGEPMVVILNDNAMSIDKNVGGMAYHFRNLRTKKRYLGAKANYRRFVSRIPGGRTLYWLTHSFKDWVRRMLIPATIFENMGFTYLGPADGHDTEELIELLTRAKEAREPVVIHVLTKKGKGYAYAEENPRKFHGIGKFDPITGKTASSSTQSFSDAFGEAMLKLGREKENLCAITAAMPGGTGLLPFAKAYPDRLYDVGIAEEHAVSMAGGLAKQGMLPVVALYSTFLQRSYDMILQDICMLGLHCILAVDRAGLVGEDGETHHGIFDVGFLRQAPGMRVLCPGSCKELQGMLYWAATAQSGPVAIRYPRGGDRDYTENAWTGPDTSLCCHRQGKDVTLITYGTLLRNAMDAALLLSQQGIEATVLRLLSVAPVDAEAIVHNLSQNPLVVVLEETCGGSGIREALAWELIRKNPACRVEGIDLGHRYITHGNLAELYRFCGLDKESIAQFVSEVYAREN